MLVLVPKLSPVTNTVPVAGLTTSAAASSISCSRPRSTRPSMRDQIAVALTCHRWQLSDPSARYTDLRPTGRPVAPLRRKRCRRRIGTALRQKLVLRGRRLTHDPISPGSAALRRVLPRIQLNTYSRFSHPRSTPPSRHDKIAVPLTRHHWQTVTPPITQRPSEATLPGRHVVRYPAGVHRAAAAADAENTDAGERSRDNAHLHDAVLREIRRSQASPGCDPRALTSRLILCVAGAGHLALSSLGGAERDDMSPCRTLF